MAYISYFDLARVNRFSLNVIEKDLQDSLIKETLKDRISVVLYCKRRRQRPRKYTEGSNITKDSVLLLFLSDNKDGNGDSKDVNDNSVDDYKNGYENNGDDYDNDNINHKDNDSNNNDDGKDNEDMFLPVSL